MPTEDFYADKIFKMVESGMGLVRPWGVLDSANKDFLSFELAFFYFFIYDYKMLSKLDSKLSKLHDIVLGAQLAALSTIESGMNGEQADKLARAVIDQANYGESFGHGLGHGIGLSVHELPRIGPGSSDMDALVDRK